MKLSPSEVRHARFLNCKLLLEAERIASLKPIQAFFIDSKVFTKAQFKRMKVVEFITELMLSIKSNDVMDKKSSIDEMMESNITDAQVKRIGREAKSIIEYIAKFIKDDDSQLKSTRFKNTADLYALAFCLWKMMKKSGMIIKDKSRAKMTFSILVDLDKQLKRYSQAHREGRGFRALPDVTMRYQKTIASNTDSGPNRKDRVEIIDHLIGSVFIRKDVDRLFSRDLKELLWHSTDKKCTLCKCSIDKFDDLEIDHRFAHASGGRTNSANAQIAHVKCNRAKGKK